MSGEGHRQDHSLSSTLRGPGHMPGVRLSSAGVAEVWTPHARLGEQSPTVGETSTGEGKLKGDL